MKVLLAIDAPLTFSEAPPSRLIYIAKSLKKEGFDVELVGRKGEKITDLKTTMMSGGKHFARLILLFIITKKMLVEAYDHLIIRGAYLAFFLLPLKIFNKKIILDFHDWNFREIKLYYKKSLYNMLKIVFYYVVERVATKYSDLIICASRGLLLLLSGREREKSIVLENGLDMQEAEKVIEKAEENRENLLKDYSIQKGRPLAAFLGNWEMELDMETMFEGCKKAGVNLIIIGEGPNIERYKQDYKDVVFTGKLPRLKALKLVSLSDVAMVPYKDDKGKHESFYYSTRKVKDYLSLGKPIFMADVKGRERFLIAYENAIFYRPGSPEDFAEKMKMVISDKKLKEKMCKNNLKLARRFDWQVLVRKSKLIEKLKHFKFGENFKDDLECCYIKLFVG